MRTSIDKGEVLASFASKQHSPRHTDWQKMQETAADPPTGLSREALDKAKKAFVIPEITVQKQVLLSLEAREKMRLGNENANWGFGEILAYASLIDEGYRVRLVGQDAERGTFHTAIWCMTKNRSNALRTEENFPAGAFSGALTLSEYAAMGLNMGMLKQIRIHWSFGRHSLDFANGAQVIFNQFISSAYQKQRLCGLVLLLPHGYEGQGPEHSSARIERVLQLCAQNNMRVAVPTTPRQIFIYCAIKCIAKHAHCRWLQRQRVCCVTHLQPVHLLSSQQAAMLMSWVMSPLPKGRLIVWYYVKARYTMNLRQCEMSRAEYAIVRLGVISIPHESLEKILSNRTKHVVWCQEEPFNQGAWLCIRHEIESHIKAGQTLVYHGRPPQASPAVGYASWHAVKQKQVVLDALGLAQKE